MFKLVKKLCSVNIVYRGWGKQGFLVKKCAVPSQSQSQLDLTLQCHLINNADTFLKLAEYFPGLPV